MRSAQQIIKRPLLTEKSARLREREDEQPERKDLEMEYEDWQRARRSRRGGGLN